MIRMIASSPTRWREARRPEEEAIVRTAAAGRSRLGKAPSESGSSPVSACPCRRVRPAEISRLPVQRQSSHVRTSVTACWLSSRRSSDRGGRSYRYFDQAVYADCERSRVMCDARFATPPLTFASMSAIQTLRPNVLK
jgi:hypothetical protein